jgi:hypothetical protein
MSKDKCVPAGMFYAALLKVDGAGIAPSAIVEASNGVLALRLRRSQNFREKSLQFGGIWN